MKTILRSALAACLFAATSIPAFAQLPAIQYFRNNDLTGMNVFETSKSEAMKYEGMKLRIGGGFTQQFQALDHENAATPSYTTIGGIVYDKNMLYPITAGFNTASANLTFDVQLEDGIRLNLTSYLAARHHNETWVKGGYIQIDKAKFLKSDLIDNIFDYVTLKIGHQEINYGDAHFRRSDGGNTIYNPFIENYLVDAFATEIGGELYFQHSGFLAMLGVTNGEIKGNVDPVDRFVKAGDTLTADKFSDDSRSMAMLWKVGYDNKFGEDFRLRLTASGYMKGANGRSTLFSGDRTGSNYFLVMESVAANPATTSDPKPVATSQFTSGRFNVNISDEVNAMAFNLLVEAYDFELFANYDMNTGRNAKEKGPDGVADAERSFTQLAVDAIYRLSLGSKDNVYAGVRYNTVEAELPGILNAAKTEYAPVTVDRIAIAAGWFITNNVLLKGEYVMQSYKDYPTTSQYYEGKFNGLVFEAVVGF